MEYKSGQISEQDLIFEVKWQFSGLLHRLDGLKDDMRGGFNDIVYLLNELEYRI